MSKKPATHRHDPTASPDAVTPDAIGDAAKARVDAADAITTDTPVVAAGEAPTIDGDLLDAAQRDVAAPDVAAADVVAVVTEEPAPLPLGARLRAAREALGLAREDIARATRLSTAVITDIENDDFARAGAPIYVRGYVRSYARAVNRPDLVAEPAAAREETATPSPVLMAAAGGRSRVDLISRYWNPLAYAALTAVVIVPVWFLVQPLLVSKPRAPDLAAIDAPRAELVQSPSATAVEPADAFTAAIDAGPPESLAGARTSVRETLADEPRPPQRPLMASMAPMPEPERAVVGDARRVTLALTAPSWVEFIGADGERLEFALLPAGTSRDYQLAGRADLRIGNVRGATLTVDGRAVDLSRFARGNIAQVTIGDDAGAQ